MGRLRDLLLALNRLGRDTGGSSAYPEPPRLDGPPEVRRNVDGEESASEGDSGR
jgi:hypothetical protein